jgi:hypothetical protein
MEDRMIFRRALTVAFGAAVLFGFLLRFTTVSADPLSPLDDRAASAAWEERIEKVARDLATDPRMKKLPEWRRREAVEFVTGNMLFIVVHELGHAIMSEMELAVLGREEDAADAFAIFTGLKIGTDFSRNVLVEAAGGWYLSNLRDKKEGQRPLFYDEHGLNAQRAYQIICFLVGSDPTRFRRLADRTEMPKSRQESCKGDYAVTAWSWEKALKPYLRKPDQPPTRIDAIYGDAPGKLAVFARSFRTLHFLESIIQHANAYAWPKPFALEMRTCNGKADARWSPSQHKIIICYEIVSDFADLYREYGDNLRPFAPAIKTSLAKP